MIVRVNIPREHDASDGSDFDGQDFEFDALPSVGQTLRFTDHNEGSFSVTDSGYLQDGDRFIPCIWLRDDRPKDFSIAINLDD